MFYAAQWKRIQEVPQNFSALPAKGQLQLLARGWRLRRTEGALGENSSDSIGQRIEPERRNAKEALRDNHQLFAEDAQLHLLPEKRGGEVSRSEEHTSELQSPCNLVCRLLLEKNKRCSGSWCSSPRGSRCDCAGARRTLPSARSGSAHRRRGCSRTTSSRLFFVLMIRGPPRSSLFPSPPPSR